MPEPQQHSAGNDPTAGEDTEQHWKTWKTFTIEAYARFHATLEADRTGHPGLTPYASVERAGKTSGTFAWWWGAAGEIRQTINSINAWGVRLHEWDAWNKVVDSYGDRDDRWDVLNHFVEPIAFFCMLQPSSFADRLALTAETLLHQANRRLFPHEPDRLDQDARPGKPLSRSDRRKQLGRLGQRWMKFTVFQQALLALDGDDYRRLTRNYRNLDAHAFSPRFMLGHVTRAIRSIVPRPELVQQPDGTFLRVDHPTQKAVSYAMSSLEPLALDAANTANLAEYQKARAAVDAFAALVEELCDRMDQLPSDGGKAP